MQHSPRSQAVGHSESQGHQSGHTGRTRYKGTVCRWEKRVFPPSTKDILYSFSSSSSSSRRCFSISSCCRETSSRKLVSSSSKPLTMFSEEIIEQRILRRLREKRSLLWLFLSYMKKKSWCVCHTCHGTHMKARDSPQESILSFNWDPGINTRCQLVLYPLSHTASLSPF